MRRLLSIVLATTIFGAPGVAIAAEPACPTVSAFGQTTYAPVIEHAAASVVGIRVNAGKSDNLAANDPSLRRWTAREEPGPTSLASGIMVASSGLIMTVNHALKSSGTATVVVDDGREFGVDVVLRDRRADLALVQIKGATGDFKSLQLGDSDTVRVGDIVFVIGNPYGAGQSVSHGIVSAVGRAQLGDTVQEYYIQTDAAMNPGDSGGALIDACGRLIGVPAAIYSQSGGSQGIGFAIPVNMARFTLASAQSGQTLVKRPWFGAKLALLNVQLAGRLGLQRPAGAAVVSVASNSPAAAGGLKMDDVIVSIDGQTIDTPSTFDYRFAMKALGGHSHLEVLRDGVIVNLDVALSGPPEMPPRDSTKIRTPSPLQGATIGNLSPALAEELGLGVNVEGIAVLDVDSGTPAQKLGLQRGDILLSGNGIRFMQVQDIERLLQKKPITRVEVDRGGDLLIATRLRATK